MSFEAVPVEDTSLLEHELEERKAGYRLMDALLKENGSKHCEPFIGFLDGVAKNILEHPSCVYLMDR
jgi:hypothetical protein